MWLGVDYYLGQWDPALMEADMDTTREVGGDVIRIAEFSWHLMEKVERQYDFSFFDGVIAIAKEKGLKVIMGIPTAATPAWLTKKHPSILSQFENGQKRTFGGCHVYCFSNLEMYEYSEKIIRALVGRYRGEKQIVAWQIDNGIDYEGDDLYQCPQHQKAFQSFLSKKSGGDIDKLNDTYGTTFWSREYNSFGEIPLPAKTITTHNPALRLDWERFRSLSICHFMDFQAHLVRGVGPQVVVMHDFPDGGLNRHVDYSQVTKSLDVVAYSNYPVWGGQKVPIPPHEVAFGLDCIRGLSRKSFWITEAIMGAQGHDVTDFLPRPNQAKMWSYQGMAHGCSSMMYFRYRGVAKGAEQFHYGVLDADNVKRWKFYEVRSFFRDISQCARAMDAPVHSDVAIVYDYGSLASFRIQRQSILLDCAGEMKKLYKAFYDGNILVDVIPARVDLSGYKVVLLPQLIITKPEFRARAETFVQNDGTLVFAYRNAVKDADNNIPFGEIVPVGYTGLTGVTVAETEGLQDLNAFPVEGQGAFAGSQDFGGIFRDVLKTRDAEVLYHYGDTFYTKSAVVTRRKQGAGTVYYLGCALDEGTTAKLMGIILAGNQIETTPSEDGVEIMIRGSTGQKVRMLINHNDHEVHFQNKTLPPFGCIVELL